VSGVHISVCDGFRGARTHTEKIIHLTNYILIASFLATFLIYPIAYELPQLLLTLTIIVCLILTLNLHGTEESNKPASSSKDTDEQS